MSISRPLQITSLLVLPITALVACSSGSTTTINSTCQAPEFNASTAESLIYAWNDGLQMYNSNNNADIYMSSGYFVMKYYTPNSILLPTLSSQIRYGTQSIYNYFTSFLQLNPLMTLPNPESNIATTLGCGYGAYDGYYNFTINPGTVNESTVEARFSFIYEYEPTLVSESFTVESGPNIGQVVTQKESSGWYIAAQQSSLLPSGH